MNNTSSTLKKKDISGLAIFEIVMSVLMLICLVLPLVSYTGGNLRDIFFDIKHFSYLRIAYNEGIICFIPYLLLTINIIVKLLIRTRISLFSIIISILTLLSAIIPILYVAELSDEVASSKTNFLGLTLSLSIASILIWPVFMGLIISVVSSLVSSINEKIRHRKEKKKGTVASKVDVSKYTTQVKNAFSKIYDLFAEGFQKLSHKKEIAIGALAVIAIVVGISMCGGDKVNFEVQLPAWNKFVTVENNVNLRQAPDANSPRLMEQQYEMDSELVWSDAPENEYGFPRSPYRVNSSAVCPVLSETSEWYEILVQMPFGYDDTFTQNVYVMKKFCQEVTPGSVGNSYFYKIPSGKFKGKYLYYDRGGMFAMPSSLTLGWQVDGGGYVFPTVFKHEFSNDGGSETYDFSQLTDDMLEEWFGELTKNPILKYHLYYNFPGTGLNRYSIDLQNY